MGNLEDFCMAAPTNTRPRVPTHSPPPTKPTLMSDSLCNLLKSKQDLFSGVDVTASGGYLEKWVKFQPSDYYMGEWVRGRRNGKGVLFRAQESAFIVACFVEDQMISSTCRKLFTDGSEYLGQLDHQGRMSGKGVLQGKQFTYTGMFVDNLFQGQGRLQAKHSTLTGTFEQGRIARGVEETQEGVYEGPFVNEMKEGQGVLRWKDGGRYEGQFMMGLMHGQGKLYDTEGNFSGLHTFDMGRITK